MSAPNLFLIYVTDTERSTHFYADLLEIEPVFRSPFYVAFEVAGLVTFLTAASIRSACSARFSE